jgi:hypothetical protein
MTKIRHLIKKYQDRALTDFGSSFYHDPITLVMASVFFLLCLALLLVLIFNIQPSSSQFPLTYNVVYGVTYASSWYGLYSYLLALVGLGVINFFIAWAYFEKERLISYLIECVNILLAGLTILFVFNLILLIS